MQPSTLDTVAEDFVKLALAVGQHDADYVDAYFGPEEWQATVEEESLGLDEILDRALALSQQIDSLPVDAATTRSSANAIGVSPKRSTLWPRERAFSPASA